MRPTTVWVTGISGSTAAVSNPRHIINSTKRSTLTLKSTYSLSHLSGNFMLFLPLP